MCDNNSFNIRQLDKGRYRTNDIGKQSDRVNDMVCDPNVKNPSFIIKGSLICRINNKYKMLHTQTHGILKISQEIPERALGLMAELAKCIATLDRDEKSMRIQHGYQLLTLF